MNNTIVEEWKIIKDFPRYSISNKGRVKSYIGKEPLLLQPYINRGYAYVKLYAREENRMSEAKLKAIHRLVAQYFCEDFSEDKHIHHKDRNTRNNNAENLMCLTEEQHREEHKKINAGEKGE